DCRPWGRAETIAGPPLQGLHVKPPSATPTRRAVLATFVAAVGIGAAGIAHAESSDLSKASLVPVAISVAFPVALVSGLGSLVVTAVESTADGVVWVVETVADGVKGSIRFAARAAGSVVVAVGTVIAVTVIATGWLLCSAGRVIAFIPNEV